MHKYLPLVYGLLCHATALSIYLLNFVAFACLASLAAARNDGGVAIVALLSCPVAGGARNSDGRVIKKDWNILFQSFLIT